MELLESFFCRCVARGQEDGTIAAGQSVELGKLLLSVLLGLRVLARTRPQRDMLEGAVAGVLGMLKK
jgi:TetR/AcrR family transcriptional repressor of nem operon